MECSEGLCYARTPGNRGVGGGGVAQQQSIGPPYVGPEFHPEFYKAKNKQKEKIELLGAKWLDLEVILLHEISKAAEDHHQQIHSVQM